MKDIESGTNPSKEKTEEQLYRNSFSEDEKRILNEKFKDITGNDFINTSYKFIKTVIEELKEQGIQNDNDIKFYTRISNGLECKIAEYVQNEAKKQGMKEFESTFGENLQQYPFMLACENKKMIEKIISGQQNISIQDYSELVVKTKGFFKSVDQLDQCTGKQYQTHTERLNDQRQEKDVKRQREWSSLISFN